MTNKFILISSMVNLYFNPTFNGKITVKVISSPNDKTKQILEKKLIKHHLVRDLYIREKK